MMPAIIDAVHSYCTLGEICGAMRSVFGEYKSLAGNLTARGGARCALAEPAYAGPPSTQ